VVAGIRLMDVPAVRSLLLGLHDPVGRLRHVGVVTQLPRARARRPDHRAGSTRDPTRGASVA
jgi:hypothetical protein